MRTLATVMLALTATVSVCATAVAADYKLGYVNTERVFRDSQLAIKATKKLEKEFKNREADIQKNMKQARDLQAYLEKEGLTLGEAERTKKQKELANLSYDLQKLQREFREDLNQRKNEEFAAVQDHARKIIQDIAEKEHYDLIVENVVFAGPKVDMTERVLKALDK